MKYKGACHCQAVQIEVDADEQLHAHQCNCSICRKTGHLHLIVPKSRFRLVCGEENLTLYQFNTAVARHYFCKTCGTKPFYIPRSNPDGVSVNIRCLEPFPQDVSVDAFDGSNWEKNAHQLSALSKDESA